MRPLFREPILALGAAMAVGPPALVHFFATTPAMFSSLTHVLFVGLTAGAATAAALALTVAGWRRGDARTVMVATAFAAMTGLLVVHGVATPGFLVGRNGVVAFSGAATLPVGGALLALCTMPALRGPRFVRHVLALEAVLLAGVIALGAVGLLLPDLVPAVPEARSLPALAALVAGLALYGLVARRAVRTYRLTRRPADGLVIVGVAWLGSALAAALLLRWSDLGWWIGHGLEVAGVAAIAAPVALDLRRAAQSRPLAGDLPAAALVAGEEAFLGVQVHGLTALLAQRDASTEEHTRRVALRAVQVGELLGLSPERLRSLAAGGLLHDIGKLGVPDAILKKPAALTEAEYELVKAHPAWGDRLLGDLGFPVAVRRLVRDHHERIDGSGYPSGIADGALDLETRILGVCDVYDALVSPRVYRDAWTHERALELLRAEAGAAFDRRCVDALARVLADELASEAPARAA
jgi:HD-GYP domain-containing protein (c-di-GMP phosphodiesterase class II)